MRNKVTLQFYQAKKEKYEDNHLKKVNYWVKVFSSQKTDKKQEKKSTLNSDFLSKTLADFLTHAISNVTQGSKSDLLIDIGFVDNQMLNDSLVFDRLISESALRKTTDSISRRFDTIYTPKPIIFVGFDNLMELKNLHRTVNKPIEDQEPFKKDFITKIHRRIDPRFRIMDANIWNRYISLIPIHSFESRFKNLVQEIIKYHEKGLYHSIVAQEYLEFSCRKLRESYVKNYPGGHAKKVTPFRFHSESRMKEMAEKKQKEISKHSWSILIVDDYANKSLRAMKREHEGKISTKKNWIEFLIKDFNSTEGQITCLPIPDVKVGKNANIGFYFNALEDCKNRPDIIILDYFFGIEERDPEEQYGHKFIKRLFEAHENSIVFTKRAFEKYWIFPISAFEHAFRSHQRLMGISAENEIIKIGDGADPINSPELFRYLLYSFLAFQKHNIFPGLNKLLNDIIYACEISGAPLNEVIKDKYNRIINLIAKAVQIKKECLPQIDNSQITDLAHSFFQNLNPEYITEDFLFCIQSLVSSIAHSEDWDQLRLKEEFMTIQHQKAKITPKDLDLTENHRLINKILSITEQYIDSLINHTR